MEQFNYQERPISLLPAVAECLTTREQTLLRIFRGLALKDQAAVIRLADALARLTDLEG